MKYDYTQTFSTVKKVSNLAEHGTLSSDFDSSLMHRGENLRKSKFNSDQTIHGRSVSRLSIKV
jgi:hypothetical protein